VTTRIVNAMSVDVEDYFHVSAFDAVVSRSAWDEFESRVVANTARLLDLFERSQPDLLRRYLEYFLAHATNDPASKLIFPSLPHVDFCRDIMEPAAARLRVFPVPTCGWTDLGTPPRVEEWLERHYPNAKNKVLGRLRDMRGGKLYDSPLRLWIVA
jgi:hypothetical protein